MRVRSGCAVTGEGETCGVQGKGERWRKSNSTVHVSVPVAAAASNSTDAGEARVSPPRLHGTVCAELQARSRGRGRVSLLGIWDVTDGEAVSRQQLPAPRPPALLPLRDSARYKENAEMNLSSPLRVVHALMYAHCIAA